MAHSRLPKTRSLVPRRDDRRRPHYVNSRPFMDAGGSIVIERRSRQDRRHGKPTPCALLLGAEESSALRGAVGLGGVIRLVGRLAPQRLLARIAARLGAGRLR